jgi:hypothetical protein
MSLEYASGPCKKAQHKYHLVQLIFQFFEIGLFEKDLEKSEVYKVVL